MEKNYIELFVDGDYARKGFPKEWFDNEELSLFDYKPLMMPCLPWEFQSLLSELEHELKYYYLLTSTLNPRYPVEAQTSDNGVRLIKAGVETAYQYHDAIILQIHCFRNEVVKKHCLSDANLERLKKYCEDNINAVDEIFKLATLTEQLYKNLFDALPEYYCPFDDEA